MFKSKNIAAFSIINGILLALILISAEFIFYLTEKLENGETWYLYIFYLLFPIFIGYCCYVFRNNKGYLKLENGLVIGLLIGVVSTLLYQTFSIILSEVIDPTLYDRMVANVDYSELDISEKEIEETKQMLESENMKNVSNIIAKTVHFSASLFLGLLYGIFGGLIFKQDNPNLIE